jgi:hypothetical protein
MSRLVLLLGIFVALMTPQHAHAYIDAGTGSLILQALLGGAVGLSAFVKLYWYKLKEFFARVKAPKEEASEE